MFRNQYAISDASLSGNISPDMEWHRMSIYLGEGAEVFANDNCIIIGKVVNSCDPSMSPNDIADAVSSCDSIESVFELTDGMAGRYIIAFIINSELYMLTDACGFKRALFMRYNGAKIITSSENYAAHIFGFNIVINEDIKDMMRDESYRRKESPWFGLTSPDERFSYLIPNHYLYIGDFSLHRMPPPKIGGDVITSASSMIKNTILALSERYKLIQPITAGIDSRILLAASESVKDKIDYYVFGDENSNHEDVSVPKELAKIVGVNFNAITPPSAPDEFKKKIEMTVLGGRDLPKIDNIYYHYKNSNFEKVNINGNGAEIFRSYYGASILEFSAKSLSILSGTKKWPIMERKIYDWLTLTEAKRFSQENNISITDLFYWEQRMAIWGSMFPLEQDIAMDEVSPFSNRKLIFTMLSESSSKRRSPDFKSATLLINFMDDRLNKVPVNPKSSNHIINFIKAHTITQLIVKKII
ncbi:hypothetical protein B2D54_RS17640 [Escherichia coli]|uniref:hypothetical protein n=1 Tax=Escherichia coli TaxID=562 RepID=UPI0017AE569C|nr:hypothetical protein [Escherichia coli]EEV5934476.1 hypothetical protein [Escherichia coli]EFF5819612.1 hypothetical protein [Escherichia coli]MBB8094395.1 hypothetical protein [Escherichia coli]MBB8265901.1 hypothetical protein [Escherichia coli]MCH4704494.1 hypothetical protein [Escherichia coli]